MAKYRVKAFFMHEHEEKAAQDAENEGTLTEPEWTEGFAIGVVDSKEIERLSQQALVVKPNE